MKLIEVDEVRVFMKNLFWAETFDKFCVADIDIKTLISYSINGKVNAGWLDDVAKEAYAEEEFVYWRDIRQVIFSLIKGENTPELLRIQFVSHDSAGGSRGLRIQFEDGNLSVMSTYTPREFSLDKTAERLWDENVENFIKKIISTQSH